MLIMLLLTKLRYRVQIRKKYRAYVPSIGVSVVTLFSFMQAVHKLTEYLCFQVRNIAGELVDGFDLPASVTRAPIAMQSEAYAQYTHRIGF